MLLTVYLQISEQSVGLDDDFLAQLKENDYKCPVHGEELRIKQGFKLSPTRSVSLIEDKDYQNNPFALCWSKGFQPEKHGPIEPSMIVYCETCQINKESQTKEAQ